MSLSRSRTRVRNFICWAHYPHKRGFSVDDVIYIFTTQVVTNCFHVLLCYDDVLHIRVAARRRGTQPVSFQDTFPGRFVSWLGPREVSASSVTHRIALYSSSSLSMIFYHNHDYIFYRRFLELISGEESKTLKKYSSYRKFNVDFKCVFGPRPLQTRDIGQNRVFSPRKK